jgi:hypothetical protein
MKIDWIYRKDEGGMVTFYDTNITLNKVASTYFVDAYAVLVGLDRTNQRLIIKNINKEEAQRGDVDKNSIHDVAIKPSYGRINGKKVVSEISQMTNFDFTKETNYKFKAKWHPFEKMLIVDLKGEDQ